MLEGRVRWYNLHMGYGFLAHQEDGQDVFVHNSVIPADQFNLRTLKRGELVYYEFEEGEKGLRATKVRRQE